MEGSSECIEHNLRFVVKDFNAFVERSQLLIQVFQRFVNEAPMAHIGVVMTHNRRLKNVENYKWKGFLLRMKKRLVIYESQIAFQPNHIYFLHNFFLFSNEQLSILKVRKRSLLTVQGVISEAVILRRRSSQRVVSSHKVFFVMHSAFLTIFV